MSKFIKKPAKKVAKKETKKAAKPAKKPEVPAEKPAAEVIKKGDQEFVICPKCGWKHPAGTTHCRFCGGRIQ